MTSAQREGGGAFGHGRSRPCRRRTCICTSPARCGTRRCWSSPSATTPPSARPRRASGPRSWWPRTRRAGSGSSGCTTWLGRSYAPKTTSPARARGARGRCRRWRRWPESKSTRPATPRGSATSPSSPSSCSTPRRGVGVGGDRHRHGHRGQSDPSPARRPQPRPAGGPVRRPRRHRLRAEQRRTARRHRGVRPAFAIAERAGLLLAPHSGELRGPDHVRTCLDTSTRAGSATACAPPRTRGARGGREAGIALEVCPSPTSRSGSTPT